MQEVFQVLTPADYEFVIGLVESNVNLTNDRELHEALAAVEELDTPDARAALNSRLEREIRYLGSADFAYLFRYLSGREPGVPFQEVIRDVARELHVKLPPLGTDRDLLEEIVQQYATAQFARMPKEEQQKMLVDLGVGEERAAEFLLKSAGVFAVPAMIEAFGVFVVQGLIKRMIFGTIAKLLGKQLSARLFGLLASRFPWWLRWIGPAAWTASTGWLVLDLQGPALRKTVPVVLYLGLCSLRARAGEGDGAAV